MLAEGVEDRSQFAFLERLGCDAVQGYFISAAVPAAEFAQLLRKFDNESLLPPVPVPAARARST